MNNVQLVGRVGKDPEVFTFENGNKKHHSQLQQTTA